jgi:hypothetical protein
LVCSLENPTGTKPVESIVVLTIPEARHYAVDLAENNFECLKQLILTTGTYYYDMGSYFHGLPYHIRYHDRAMETGLPHEAYKYFIIRESKEVPDVIQVLETCGTTLRRIESSLQQDTEFADLQTVVLGLEWLCEFAEKASILVRNLQIIMGVYPYVVLPDECRWGQLLEEDDRYFTQRRKQWMDWCSVLPSVCFGTIAAEGDLEALQRVGAGESFRVSPDRWGGSRRRDSRYEAGAQNKLDGRKVRSEGGVRVWTEVSYPAS